MSEAKYIKNPIKYLRDSGLLFEINRSILHPLGLALSVQLPKQEGEDIDLGIIQLWDSTEDDEGIVYGEQTFTEGLQRYTKYMDEEGDARMEKRLDQLGYYVQNIPDPYYIKNGIELTVNDEETGQEVTFRVPSGWLATKVEEWYGFDLEEFLQAKIALDIDPIYTEAVKDKVIIK